MKKLIFFIISASLLFVILPLKDSEAVMEDYCAQPTYVTQSVPPNIMIILDNSGSMFNFAYFDGFTTTTTADDNMCDAIGTPCTGFATPGAYPTYKFYGYFNPDYWYTYGSNRFTPTAPKTGSGLSGARAKTSSEWDGNFLNWLTMRRVDIIRKVMTGGLSTGSGLSTRLLGEIADYSGRGIYKSTVAADTPNYTEYTGNRTFTFNTAASGTSSFSVSGGGGTFNVDVIVALTLPLPAQTASQIIVEGVLQRVVGAKARVGLTFYNNSEGGRVQTSVAATALPAIVNQINNTRPSTWTPLAETLWTVTGYFAQRRGASLTTSCAGGGSDTNGPKYFSAAANSYNCNNTNDPLNYGTGGTPVYRSCAKSYVLLITDGEPCNDGNLPDPAIEQYASGKSIYDCSGTNCPAAGPFPAQTIPACTGNVAGIEDVALYAHTTDLRSSTIGVNAIDSTQNLTLYVVSAFGRGSTLLRYAAINGGFEDRNSNDIPDLQSEWDNNTDNEPDTYYEATEGSALETSIEAALSNMLKRASSGTAASVLASGEGKGGNLLQAVFYPGRQVGNDVIVWTGAVQNLWYYIDPFFTNSNIRENTAGDTTTEKKLDLQNDFIMKYYFDFDAASTPPLPKTKAKRWQDTDGDGDIDTPQSTVLLEDVKNIWEGGKSLWERDITTDGRTIYTTTDESTMIPFSTANAAILEPYMQAANPAEADRIIRYINGEDITLDANPADGVNDYRARTVTIGADTKVWKLGDILNSTPKISSSVKLNTYDTWYYDNTYADFVATTTTTTPPVNYKGRGMVFVGGNDGMLHAFDLGFFEDNWTGKGTYEHARLTSAAGTMGKEKWAFIPKNALPYLKYIGNPEYCHIYTVDLTPFTFDASISGGAASDPKTVNSWKTILIGGMRTGGACRNDSSCFSTTNTTGANCVNVPRTDPADNTKGLGYSSYFALDITDQNNPVLLWEFSEADIPATDRGLGFATTGPAIVKVGDRTTNGKWFVVFGSGPTGPIITDTAQKTSYQFMGRSDQNLRLYILDLRTGNLERTIDTGIQNAFAGSMVNSTIDPNVNYMDEAFYAGYTTRTGAGTVGNPYTWTIGGVGRVLTNEDPDPANWQWSTVIDNIGPVTSSVSKLFNKRTKALWLFFGEGRSYYVTEDNIDDPTNRRRLFGIKDPCYSSTGAGGFIVGCTSQAGALTDVTNIANAPSESVANSSGFNGWYLYMDIAGNYTYAEGDPAVNVTKNYGAERVITGTTVTSAGLVFFTSFKPYTDICSIGGKTFLWATRYNTGGDPSALLKGKAIVQVSTGSIEEVDLATAFNQSGDNRKSDAAMEGAPPTDNPPAMLTPPNALKRILHIKER